MKMTHWILALWLCLLPSLAAAVPTVEITSGYVIMHHLVDASILLEGPNFSAGATVNNIEIWPFSGASGSGGRINEDYESTFTWQGQQFVDIENSFLNFSHTFPCDGCPYLPHPWAFSVPFTLDGFLSDQAETVALHLTGQGTLTVFSTNDPYVEWPQWWDATYTFAPRTSVPEPSTLGLQLPGVALIGLAWKRAKI